MVVSLCFLSFLTTVCLINFHDLFFPESVLCIWYDYQHIAENMYNHLLITDKFNEVVEDHYSSALDSLRRGEHVWLKIFGNFFDFNPQTTKID